MKLKEFRKAAGLTQEQLGSIVGASPVSISLYENEKQSPDVNMLVRIADALNTSVDALLDHNPVDTDDAWDFREQMRNNPSYRMLFNAADKAKPEHLRAAAAMLKSLEGDSNDY